MGPRFWLETLGCPKNEVDSAKLRGLLDEGGYGEADGVGDADLIVVNTCAFVEDARQESIDTVLALADARRPGSRLVLTGCLAERHGAEVVDALPEVDVVAGFGVDFRPRHGGVPVALGPTRSRTGAGPARSFDLLELPRPATGAPWAYVKVAEGCDRACGFCAIPTFRGPQRSRRPEDVVAEVEALVDGGTQEVVLVAQDLASYGRDRSRPGSRRQLVPLVSRLAGRVPRLRLLYLYPSELDDRLVEAVLATGVAYFDLSLQHASRPLLARMRRWGDGDRFLERIDAIRSAAPEAAFRSNFIVGYPGETEADHDRLLDFVAGADLDWCGFFPYSREEGTRAAGLDGAVPAGLVHERLDELSALQDQVTARRRDALIGTDVEVLVDRPGQGRSHREAPQIDGLVHLPRSLGTGTFATVHIVDAEGPDLVAAGADRETPVVEGLAAAGAVP